MFTPLGIAAMGRMWSQSGATWIGHNMICTDYAEYTLGKLIKCRQILFFFGCQDWNFNGNFIQNQDTIKLYSPSQYSSVLFRILKQVLAELGKLAVAELKL